MFLQLLKKVIFCTQTSTIIVLVFWLLSPTVVATEALTIGEYTLVAGHSSLKIWTLPEPSHPATNEPTKERIALGRALFFDVRLSGNGEMSCASCHIPKLGWSDGLATAKGANGKKLRRATPTIINTAYNYLHMWDGRFENLEAQVIAPLTNEDEMNTQPERLLAWLRTDSQYSEAFAHAYPEQGITIEILSKAIATFERTVISADSLFDRWIRGERAAMTESQVNGFKVFLDPNKGNCVVCHTPPNFSDDGYHDIGIDSDRENPDNGRFDLIPVSVLKGAFKTPTLRDIQSTHPYFHNGSAQTLADVLDHYILVDDNLTTVSPSLKRARITEPERENLLDFLGALTDTQHLKALTSDSTVEGQSPLTDSNTISHQSEPLKRNEP